MTSGAGNLLQLICMRSGAGNLLAGLVLGDGLGALGDGVLGELAGEDEADGGLDLASGERGLLVVVAQLAGLAGDASEGVVDEAVEDAHRALGDASVGVHLLEDLVDVDVVGLSALLAAGRGSGGGHAGAFFLEK